MTPLRATYRLQLNKDFTFADATALVPYLDELGISHAYLSPILQARPGSTHGYDTVDHTRINAELGSMEDFRALAAALQARGMGIILDFVPNHMGVGGADNWLWLDVLRHGQASRYAEWFDIDWTPPRAALHGKLLVPFLGSSYAESLAAGHIALRADADGFAVWAHGEHKLPIRPEDDAALGARWGSAEAAVAALSGHAGLAELDALIATQHWRLSHYASASDEINYRRFFVNSDLAGIRIDRPDVFNHAHSLIFALIEEGLVDGLRIDHVDGLLDPKGYLETLQSKSPRPIYLAIEKILAPHEALRRDWPVDGTTGYEFGAALTRVLQPANREATLTRTYRNFVGDTPNPQTEAYRCKLRVMDNELAAELATLTRHLTDIAWSVPETRDLTEIGLRKAVREVIAHLNVYRTYVDDGGSTELDRRELGLAIARARLARPHYPPAHFDFLDHLFSGQLGAMFDRARIAFAIGRFQQYTGPVMAKGLEDTALYRYNRLVCLNEVGAHPERFSIAIDAFHDANRRRLAEHPSAMLATSTHDTKRGEDIRAIIGAIADHADHWGNATSRWRTMLPGADTIHPNDLYLFFQLLLGGWPVAGSAEGLGARLKGAMVKSLREARLRSDWGVADEDYEAKVAEVIETALGDARFLENFHADRTIIHETGGRKALIQVALKLTVPGVPDIYRGAEDWEQSFMDPDNRRRLDFAALAQRLAGPMGSTDDKLVLTRTLLSLRRDHPLLFAEGSYEPIDLGPETLAFRRIAGAQELAVAVDLSIGHAAALTAELASPHRSQVIGGTGGPISISVRNLL